MPIYEYRCQQCTTRFEKLVRRLSEPGQDPPSCPQCGSEDTERVMSGFAIHGPPGVDLEQAAAEHKQAERTASITPKSQIDKWRSARDKK